MKKKFFGTDGIRGCVGQHPITAEFMLKLGWAAGKVFSEQGFSRILIGKDTRISGYMFESALEAGIISAGVSVSLLGPMPTPAIAYLTRTFHAQAGIVISASHNPFEDNGIKFFSQDGTKLPDEIELAIESYLESQVYTVPSSELGKASRIDDAAGRYIEFCKSTAPAELNLADLKIVVDCANGATYHVAPSVFSELGATLHAIGVAPDGLNINKNCGATKPQLLADTVRELGYDLGVAFDGDGDRLMMVDHTGQIVDGDELVYVIAKHRREAGQLEGGVVGTLMSNLGMEIALNNIDIPFKRAKVGDRYVLELLQHCGWVVGGESSGHIICLDKTTTGDGIVSSLQVLGALQNIDFNLHQARQGMKKMPQNMINVRLRERTDPSNHPSVKSAIVAAERELAEKGRVLLRMSGTEPVVRVMIEGEDADNVERLTQELAQQVQQVVGTSS